MDSSVISYENALKSFVPDILLRKLRRRIGTKIKAESKLLRGACLLADISGFTKLSGELCSSGTRGLDDLRRATSSFLATFIHIVHAFGGDVISFAGDALVCIFWPPERSDPSGDYRLCRRATECGFILKDHCTNLLSAHMAVSYGELCFSFLGGYMNEWVYIVNGACMSSLSSCIDDAGAKQLVITKECLHALNEAGGCFDISYKQLSTGNVLVNRIQRLANISSRSLGTVLQAAAATTATTESELTHSDIRSLRKIFLKDVVENVVSKCSSHILKFLPRPVVSTLSAGYFNPMSELRTVTTVFLKLDSYSQNIHSNSVSLQDFFYAAQVALANSGGCLRQFLVDDKGCVLIALWGVPSASFGNNASRAIQFAIEVCRSGHLLGHTCSIGITTGSAFCGTIGSPVRQDYAAIGSKVNQAARLMMRAEGKILLDDNSHATLPPRMKQFIREVPPLQLKGSDKPVQAFSADWNVPDGESNLDDSLLDSWSPQQSKVPSAVDESDDEHLTEDILDRGRSIEGINGYCSYKAMQSNLSSSIVETLNATMTRLMNYEYMVDGTTRINSDCTQLSVDGASDDKEEIEAGFDSLPLMQFIVVEGCQGMGKSEVCRYFRRLSLNNKVRNIALRAHFVDEKRDYGVARRLFQEIIGADLQKCPERRKLSLQLLQRAYPLMSVEDVVTLKFPMLKAALGLKWHLSLRQSAQCLPFNISKHMGWKLSVGSVLVDILKSLLSDNPLTIVIDDAHYCDRLTWNFLHLLSINIKFPVVALVAVRKSSLSELLCPDMSLMSPTLKASCITPRLFVDRSKIDRNFKSRGLKAVKTPVMVAVDSLLLHSAHVNQYYRNMKIVLSPLAMDQLRSLLAMTWGPSIAITDDLLEIMRGATDMNPFWCKCFAEFARDYGTDCLRTANRLYDDSNATAEAASSGLYEDLYESVWNADDSRHATRSSYFNAILANMMDKLSVTEQMVLKMGSVIGVKFSFSLLKSLLPTNMWIQLKPALHVLTQRRFIEHVISTGENIYSFQNTTIRELVYKFIPPSDAAKFHIEVASEIETTCSSDLGSHYDLLLYHYLRGTPQAAYACSPSPRDEVELAKSLKRKTFRIACKAAIAAIRSGTTSRAIAYMDVAESVSTNEEQLRELLVLLDDAASSLKVLMGASSGQLDFLSWDAGDEELLELKDRLLSSLDAKTTGSL